MRASASAKVRADRLQLIVGSYYDSLSTDVRVLTVRGDSLYGGRWGNTRLRAADSSTFADDSARERLGFSAESSPVWLRLLDGEGRERTYWRQRPPNRDHAALLALAGRYESPELGSTYTLSVRGDDLWLQPAGQSAVRLVPVFAAAFRWGIWRLIEVRYDGRGSRRGSSCHPSRRAEFGSTESGLTGPR
ncbi:MAG TPA: hypothetical protein VM076_21120 [Gemmatimonadaceae bacterium]|nr:hypothetical protein [Gemmatimonadaceae bacterium]